MSDVTNPTDPGMFAGLIQEALNKAVTPEVVRTKVEEHVDKLVGDAITAGLSSWSSTGSTLKEAVTESLRVGDRLNIPSYGHVVSQILERQIQATVSDVIAAKLHGDMEGLLTLAPKRVKLSELVEGLLGHAEEDSGEVSEVHCDIHWNEYDSAWLSLSKEVPQRHQQADIRLLVSLEKKEDGKDREGKISLGSVGGSDLKKDTRFGYGTDYATSKARFGSWFGFEQKVLSMYAVGTVIELDEDAVVTSRWED